MLHVNTSLIRHIRLASRLTIVSLDLKIKPGLYTAIYITYVWAFCRNAVDCGTNFDIDDSNAYQRELMLYQGVV